ncbi:TRAP transporter small permease subunit [Thalassotalea euphylliae]|uniref:TRAP transporter small permease protein n=1 Tax=Thalassotalea euphylliae TaxID=1655234 RepID=A0A3E0U104_9GAMM|nr:TRAP transporter small permease subunit [Thalassotalea euphylliae]REL30618.1 permease [Thalassotalea euphylliae]
MNGLTVFLAMIDRITVGLGAVIRWLTLLMVVLTFAIVVLRYGFNIGWIAMQESVLYLHGLVFMLGAAYTLKADGHVRVDIFYQGYTAKQKALVNLMGTLILLLPVVIFVFIVSFDYVLTSWRIAEKSSEAGGLPFVYLSKTYLWLFAIALGLQGLAEIIRNINTLVSKESESEQSDGNSDTQSQSHQGDKL